MSARRDIGGFNPSEEVSSITFLDVGRGSSIVVHSEGHTCLVDVGPARAKVVSSLPSATLDAIVLTHFHDDHVGGLRDVLRSANVAVQTVYVSDPTRLQHPQSGTERSLAEWIGIWCARTNRTICELVAGDTFQVGKIACTALWPSRDDDFTRQHRDENRRSIVLRLEFDDNAGGQRTVLTGDAGPAVFAELAKDAPPWILTCDVLGFPHHGCGCGSAAQSTRFAKVLGTLTKARKVVFQNGANYPANPHPAIIAGIRRLTEPPDITCTELARECGTPQHADSFAPRCAGSVTFLGSDRVATDRGDRTAHLGFVDSLRLNGVESALCRVDDLPHAAQGDSELPVS